MSLIKEIQEAAVDSSIGLPTLLRKARLLAARIGSEEIAKWVGFELNGYPSKDSLPQYRFVSAQSLGDFYSPLRDGMKNAPIPGDALPSEYREYATSQFFLAGVGELEELVQSNKSRQTIHLNWSHDILLRLGPNIYSGHNCFSAWKLVSRSAVVGILETVRNRVLDLTIEIEAEVLDSSDEDSLGELSIERSQQVFNTIVMGNVGNLAPGSTGFSQTSDLQVMEGDLTSLRKCLEKLQVPAQDIDELESIIQDEDRPNEGGTLGAKTAQWVGNMVSKAVSRTWDVSSTMAADVLTKAILTYFGIG